MTAAAFVAACEATFTPPPSVVALPQSEKLCGESTIRRAEGWLQEGRLERLVRVAKTPPAGCESVPRRLLDLASDAEADIRRIAKSRDPDAVYEQVEAARKKNDLAEANRLLAGALRALEARGRAPASLGNREHVARWYHGPVPARGPASPRGRLALDADQAFVVVDAATGREAFRVEPALEWALSPDHAWLLADADEKLVVTKLATQNERAVLAGNLAKAVFDPGSKLLAWVNDQNQVAVMDLKSGEQEVVLPALPPSDPDASPDTWERLVFSADSKLLAAAANERVVVFDLARDSERLRAPSTGLTSYVDEDFSPDSRWFGWIGDDGVHAMDLESGRRLHVRLPAVRATSLGFHPTRAELVIGGELGRVFVHDLKRHTTRTLDRGYSKAPREETTGSFTQNAHYAPDGSHVVFSVGAATQTIDAKSGAVVRWPDECLTREPVKNGRAIEWTVPMPDRGCQPYSPTVWSRSGRLLFARSLGGEDGLVTDWTRKRALWTSTSYPARPEFSEDERWFLDGSRVFDAESGELLPTPRGRSAAGSVSDLEWANGILQLAVDFGRGLEVCTLDRERRMRCRSARGWDGVLLGSRPLFNGTRTLPGKELEQVEELRDADGKLVAKSGVGSTFAMPPSSDVVAALSDQLRFLDPSGTPTGSPLPVPAYPSAVFNRVGSRLAVWGQSAGKTELFLIDTKERRELLRTTILQVLKAQHVTQAPVAIADRGAKVFVAETDHVRGIDTKTGKVAISVDAKGFELFAASDTRPLLLVATRQRAEKSDDQSRIQVFDVSGSKPSALYAVTIPATSRVEWIPESESWMAVTRDGLIFISPKPKPRRARIQLFPTGIAMHWDDDSVELGPNARAWLACNSGDYALPADACEDRFAPLDGLRALW